VTQPGAPAVPQPGPPAVTPRALLPSRPWHVSIAAFAAGLALAESSAALVLLAAAGLAALLAWLGAPRLSACAAALLLAGAAAGDLRLAALDRHADRIRDGDAVTARAHLLTPPRPSAFGAAAEVAVTSGRLRGARLLVRAARWSPLPRALDVGDELRLEGRLTSLQAGAEREGSGSPAGGHPSTSPAPSRDPPFDYAAYLRRRGVAGELLLERARATGRRRGGLAGVLDRMRERAERGATAGMGRDEAALLRGMVLGQDEHIDEATREDWRDAGLAHLLAVSGQNVMLLAALALPLLMLAGVGLRTRLAALALLIAVYVPLAGAGPSLQRAGVMGLAGLAAMAASRPASRWYALLLAAAATLAWNPRAWGDPGWQLSFAAVAGILTLGVPLQRGLRRALTEFDVGRVDAVGQGAPWPREGAPWLRERAPRVRQRAARLRRALLHALADGVAITLAATLATAPLLAHHFGSVPLAGLPANLLALPAVAPAMWLGMLKAALGQLSTPSTPAPVGDHAAAAAAALGAAASLPVRYLTTLGERFADMPGGQLELPLRSATAVLGAYAALALAGLGAHRACARIAPRLTGWAATWHGLARGRRRALAGMLVVAALVVIGALLSGPGSPARLTVRFLDVGQGDATLVQHPDGTAVLFDGGPPEAGAARLLRRAGVRRLALVVATHASRDHHGGLPAVLERFAVDLLLDGGDGSADPSFRALLRQAAEHGTRRIEAIAPQTLTLAGGELRIRVLSPPPRPPGPAPEDPNPRAVVAVLSAGDFDLLLSGDAESETLLPLDLPDVDAMKVPHHGSSDPGLPEVLARVDPELAAIEVGPNTYGHPAPSTLAALDHARVATYRTDTDGTITLSLAGGEMRVAVER
jgi:competence protein ComEC